MTVGDLILAETSYDSGQVIQKHSHKLTGFVVILSGAFLEIHESRKRDCKSTDVIFRPGGELHAARFESTPSRCFNVEFGSDWLSRLQRTTGNLGSWDPAFFSGGVLFQLGLKLYNEFRMPDVDSPLIMEGLALEMLGEANRLLTKKERSGAPLWLQIVREKLHALFAEPLSVRQLAMEAGVHPIYLHRAFRKHYGQSMGEYVRIVRIQFCRTQLASSSRSLADISVAAGFYDQAHFSRIFKRMCGMTPLAYRRFFREV